MQYRGDQSPDADGDQRTLDQRRPSRRGCELGLQSHLGVQVGGFEELGAGKLTSVRGDDRADTGGSRDDHISVVFDRPQPGEGELL